MAGSPYEPPRSPVADPESPRQGSYVKAVVLGVLTDIGGTYAATIVFMVLVGIVIGAGGGNASDVAPLLAESGVVRGMLFVIGGGCSVLGGYVAARIANRVELNVSLFCGLCSLLIGVLLDAGFGPNEQPPEQTVLMFATVPAALLGGWLRKRSKLKAAAPPS